MSKRKFNSTEQAAKISRLATIRLAAQRAAFKANGGTVQSVRVTQHYGKERKRLRDELEYYIGIL